MIDYLDISNILIEAEQEYLAKRKARKHAIGAARDQMIGDTIADKIAKIAWGKIKPYNLSRKKTKSKPRRIVNLLLSDLHIGAKIDSREGYRPYGYRQAARRLSYVTDQVINYKPQYRDHTTLHLYINGDIINGELGHDRDDSEPLADQYACALQYLGALVGAVAAQYPRVEVFCTTGNHERNKMRHDGRATIAKWDGYGTMLYVALKAACANLKNVRINISRHASLVVPVFDQFLLLTHGDTDLKLGDPDSKGALFRRALDNINNDLRYGVKIDLLAVGHFHKPRYMPFAQGRVIVNGALTGQQPYGRSAGYEPEKISQWLWESVPGHIFGDARNLEINDTVDLGAALDSVIPVYEGFEKC